MKSLNVNDVYRADITMFVSRNSGKEQLLSKDDYIIEFHKIGSFVKVSAIDPVTMTEVSLSVPANLSQHEAAQAAIQKLKYVIKRRNGLPPDGTSGEH